ncbi:hypothetical protein Scep_014326 [Stephania cephalantha]|uniref:Uncharacterized protein n=1 Tax=Stephania cephalantha TaxID=152367 RepID=A0AAP0J1T1_9MAGN
MARGKKEGGLGFRKLELINIAFLAKTYWRPLENSTFMLARCLNQVKLTQT